MIKRTGYKIFTANGVFVLKDLLHLPLSWFIHGAAGLTYTPPAHEGIDPSGGGTFGTGAVVLEGTNASADELGLSDDAWAADTTNGIWSAVSLDGSAYSINTGSENNWLDAPFRNLRFRLYGATSPVVFIVANIGSAR